MNTIFHGSAFQGLTVLSPFKKSNNTISSKSVVYLTPNRIYALFYIWNRPYKWVTFDIDDQGIVIFTENYENHLVDFYNGVSGCIYECDAENPDIYITHIKGVYNSENPVSVIKYTYIENAYEEIIKKEQTGLVQVKRFATLSDEERAKISIDTILSIHLEKFLISPEKKSDDIKAKIAFVQEKFPYEWEIASKNTPAEIDEMHSEWRASMGI